MKNKIVWVIIGAIGFGLGLQAFTNALVSKQNYVPGGCVDVYVDYGKLSTLSQATQCVSISGNIRADVLLTNLGYKLQGTDKYPSEIVCRVNNLPSPETEPCRNMPPANAYWAIIVKEDGRWGFAQTGISGVQLEPGQGVGLVYAINGKVNFPK